MNINIIISVLIAFLISVFLTPIIGKITKNMGIIAHTNNRTIHQGIIPRTGGYAIYVSFILCASIFLKTDYQINTMLIGGFIIFMVGLYDDIHDLSPKLKLLGQILPALIVIFFGGISLKDFTIPYLPTNISYILAIIITLGWIIGITNAINLIDGLDGLCAGIVIICLITMAITSFSSGRNDIAQLALILAASTGGFLVFNFHPAKIFMGDCGALFLGFMISVISLLGYGYKSSAFFTLGAPIVVLGVPMADTLIAIIRRKLNHKPIDEADKGHLHHQLMFKFKLGQTKSVLALYGITIVFALISINYARHPLRGLGVFLLVLFLFEIFVEVTDMISRKYKPVLTILNIFIRSDNLPKIKESAPYKKFIRRNTIRLLKILLVLIVITGSIVGYQYYQSKQNEPPVKETVIYKESSNPTELMTSIYKQIDKYQDDVNITLAGYVAAYFVTDYYTLSNKDTNEIGGTNYFYKSRLSAFKTFAKTDYYANANKYIKDEENDIEVISYTIDKSEHSTVELSELEDYPYYDITITINFNKTNPILKTGTTQVLVTVINKDDKISIVSFNNLNIENI